MGRLIRDFPWENTSIGPIADWPQSLKSVTEALLLSPVPIVLLWNEDGVMIYNDAYSEFAGERHPELLGSRVREGWGEVSDFNDNIMRVGLGGGTLTYRNHELILRRRGQLEPAWMDLFYSPVLDESGKPAGVIAIVVEITDRVIAERGLVESERRFRALVGASSDGIYSMSPDWRELRSFQGAVPSMAPGSNRLDWMDENVPAEDLPEVKAAIAKAIDQKAPFAMEHRLRQPDGGVRWVASRCVPILDDDGDIVEWFGSTTDVTDRYRANEHLRLVINELNHRVKNTLAMVQAIAARTFRDVTDVPAAQEQFASRLVALAQANDLLTGERWAGASLRSAIEQSVRPHCQGEDRCRLSGPDIRISPKTALALALATHELATNAVKYGAWSNDEGLVNIDWSIAPDDRLLIEWREEGGPAVTAPARRGFGSRLIERGLAGELGGKVSLQFEPKGVRCTIDAPMTIALED